MFYCISFPLIDKRIFLNEDTYRLDLKQFPRNWNDASFLRSFGMYGYRNNPDASMPYSEKKYAKGNRGVRVANQWQILWNKKASMWMYASCVFRRVFFDDYSARVDIGIRQADWNSAQVSPKEITFRTDTILQYNVCVEQNNKDSLSKIGGKLAYKFLFATTTSPSRNWKCVDPHWVVSATPCIIIEAEQKSLTKEWQENSLFQMVPIPADWGVSLYHWTSRKGITVWVIAKDDHVQKDKMRALRIYLLKLNQERETLKVFRDLVAASRSADSILDIAAIEEYLDTVTSIFSRKRRDGIEQQPIMDVVREADISANGNENQILLEYLERNLTYLRKRCEKTMDKTFVNNGTINGTVVLGDNTGKVKQTYNQNEGIDSQDIKNKLKELEGYIPGKTTDKSTFDQKAREIINEIGKENPNKGVLEQLFNVIKGLKTLSECGAMLQALANALGIGS